MAGPVMLSPGTVFAGDYRVERALAEGGMGAVYVAQQLSTGKRRALKVMHPTLIPDERSRERFVEEARVGGQIDSEHVVEVLAAGVDPDTSVPWLAMELLEGVDLDQLVKERGALPPAEALDLLEQVAHGLALAHARGIIHRDLKPENLFLAKTRRKDATSVVKILDFGIARMIEGSQTAATVTSAIGSPLWMAPEQAQPGAKLRPATDVWALGLIAFYLLTGKTFWRAANITPFNLSALLVEVMTQPIEPASSRARELGVTASLPPSFDAWLARCLDRDPEARFADAGEAIAELGRALAGRSVPATMTMAPAELPSRAATAASSSDPGTGGAAASSWGSTSSPVGAGGPPWEPQDARGGGTHPGSPSWSEASAPHGATTGPAASDPRSWDPRSSAAAPHAAGRPTSASAQRATLPLALAAVAVAGVVGIGALAAWSLSDDPDAPPGGTREQPGDGEPLMSAPDDPARAADDPAADDPAAAPTATVRLDTTEGPIVIDVYRAWAPRGADRFLQLVREGYYTDVAFFRVMEGFMAQAGIHGDPEVNARWRARTIPDDPVVESNTRGMVSFAAAGPDTRNTQFFVNLADNSRLDSMGFAPFGRVRDMSAVDRIHSGYGEGAPGGGGPSQPRVHREGNAYLRSEFPELDYIRRATIVGGDAPAPSAASDDPNATPPNVHAPPPEAERSESGLSWIILRPGTGDEHPGPTDTVLTHYAGWRAETGQLFDSSYRRGRPARFPLGRVIDGWSEALQMMVSGERRRVWIPAHLAYEGRPEAPQGMLVFDIELLEIAERGGSDEAEGASGGAEGDGAERSGGEGSAGASDRSGGSGAGAGGRVRPQSAAVRGSLDREVITRVVRQHTPAVRACYERELRGRPNLQGRVTVAFTILPSGSVSTASVQSSSLGDSRVESCLLGVVRRMRFPAPRGGGVVAVRYPFVFRPS